MYLGGAGCGCGGGGEVSAAWCSAGVLLLGFTGSAASLEGRSRSEARRAALPPGPGLNEHISVILGNGGWLIKLILLSKSLIARHDFCGDVEVR